MKMTARKLRLGLNLWPPLWGAGIRVLTISNDWTYTKVRLRKYWFNRNYVNTHYGGSLFSMTDPFYMLMVMQKMGKGYIIWDKKAEIKFIKAVKQDVFAEFKISQETIEDFKTQLETEEKIEPVFEVDVLDADGLLVAKVWKTLYLRKK